MSIEKINLDLCNGCGICVDSCTMDCLRLDTLVQERGEHPQCRLACPAEVDIRTYTHLMKNGMLEEALQILRESLPLPAITGRVCPHPCESQCARKEVDAAVNVNALERYLGDCNLDEPTPAIRTIYSDKTAIIGSGPAGLSCAYFLRRQGYPVAVFESQPVLGGMLRLGIPEYRLPKSVVESQVKYIRDMGVEFKTGMTFGKEVTLESLRKAGYSAIFLALGAQASRKIRLKGTNLKGVEWGLDFLKQVKLIPSINLKGETVIVMGGGNVAIDVALTALRLGAKNVHLVCLEKREEMPAYPEEIQQALEEDVLIHNGWGPWKINGIAGKASSMEFIHCDSVFDNTGSFNPAYNPRKTQILKGTKVILAIGQACETKLLPGNLALSAGNTLQVDPLTQATNLAGVFGGGDLTGGPGSVIEAIASGKRAAASIDRYHKGQDLIQGRTAKPNRVRNSPKEGIEPLPRQSIAGLSLKARKGNFKEVKATLSEDQINLEVRRCMTCGSRAVVRYPADCMLCIYCERDCPQKAIYVSPDKKVNPILAWG